MADYTNMSFSFGGVHSDDLGIDIAGYEFPLMAEYQVEIETIPGRGPIYLGTNYASKKFNLHCVIGEEDGDYDDLVALGKQLAQVLNPLLGPQKLIFDREPDVYYNAVVNGTVKFKEAGPIATFDLEFICVEGVGFADVEIAETPLIDGNNDFDIDIDGDTDCPIVFTINGTTHDMTIKNVTTDETLTLDLDTGSSDSLVLDFNKMTITLNDSENKLYTATGTFWRLQPGSNLVRINPGSSGATAAISYSNRYI